MAFVLMAEGDKDRAIEYVSKARGLDTMIASGYDTSADDDPTVLRDRYALTSLLFYAGRVDEALEEHKEVLGLREEVCTCHNQFNFESREAVGILLHLTGRDAEAT